MRKLLNEISRRLQSFVDQRDDVALILTAPATDALPLLKMIEGLEDASASDFFWTYTDNFTDAAAYAAAVVKAFAATHEAMRLSMEKEGMTPWPPISPAVLSDRTPPAQRLRDLAAFSRELVPIPGGGVVVWTYFPLEIANASAYAALMADVLAHDFPFPWCHHLRFIVREDPADPAIGEHLKDAPRLQWYAPDMSTEAVNRSMQEELDDESLPLAERMATLMVVAGTDLALGRHQEALEKYALLLQYHAPMGSHPMAAIALNGMGEVYERMGDLEPASQAYEAALIPASHGEHPPVPIFLTVVLNLANLRRREERWEEAEGYYDAAQQLATVARDAALKVRCLENRGYCQQQQGKRAETEQSWNGGVVIAAQLPDVSLCADMLARLHQHYTVTKQTEKARAAQAQLADLGRPVKG